MKKEKPVKMDEWAASRMRLASTMDRVKEELKTALSQVTAKGVSLEETSKVIGIASAVDDLLGKLPTGRVDKRGYLIPRRG